MLNYKEYISSSKGFTLIELLITLALIAIVLTIGIPSFSQTITSSRLTTNANRLLASLNMARSEAIKRGVNIYVERIGGASQNWDGGWNVFIDLNANQTYNAGTDTLLKTYPSMNNGYTVRTGANYDDWVAYLPTGLISSSGAFTNDSFTICATAGDLVNSRRVILNTVGRARVSSGDAASCP